MDLARAARTLNAVGYGYIESWALLTACEERLFDRLPATVGELSDTYPDADLTTTWLHVLRQEGIVEVEGGRWHQTEEMRALLTGEGSYADYLGGQILGQMVPRLTLGPTGRNVLADALGDPASRTGYHGWFAEADEALTYQRAQYAGSIGPARAVAKLLPAPRGPVLDLGGGWGAIARAIAERHDVHVDVVDLEPVIATAPTPGDGVALVAGDALHPTTWPADPAYDGAVLSYLFSSIPADRHAGVVDALAARGVRWIAVHDFVLDAGAHAPAWCLQHAVFVPGHRSYTSVEVGELLGAGGFPDTSVHPIVDEMTAMVVATR